MPIVNSYSILDFYALPEEIHVELINGRYYEMPVLGAMHQDLASYFHILIGEFISELGIDCKIYEGSVNVMILQDDYNMFQPDLMIVTDKSILGKREVYGAPDFVLEIISDEIRRAAIDEKVECYERAGVKKLLIVDIKNRSLTVYDHDGNSYNCEQYDFVGKVDMNLLGGQVVIDLEKIGCIADDYEKFID